MRWTEAGVPRFGLVRAGAAGHCRSMRCLPPLLALLVLIGTPAAAETPTAPYEAQLLRLSELMGALHYLRGLCQAPDATAWRAKMNTLIASEGLDEAAKARYAGAFNRGYRTFRLT